MVNDWCYNIASFDNWSLELALSSALGAKFVTNFGINTVSQTFSNGGDINKIDWWDATSSGLTSLIPAPATGLNWGAIVTDGVLSGAIDFSIEGCSYVGDGNKTVTNFLFDAGAGITTGAIGEYGANKIDGLVDYIPETRAVIKALKPALKNTAKQLYQYAEGELINEGKKNIEEVIEETED